MRSLLVLLHRYVGLLIAAFLLVAGLTGSLLVWYHELDAAINPGWLRVVQPLHDDRPAPVLHPLVLREKVQQAFPQAQVHHVPLRVADAASALTFFIEPHGNAQGQTQATSVDEVFVDPYTGEVLGARKWGDISSGIDNLMPFVYRLHFSLALDTLGTWVLGIVALLWAMDCFVGAWLTFPQRRGSASGAQKGWWARWQPAWRVRWSGGSYKLNFDLHRAGGLWPWVLLFVLAWSSVAFNLNEPVYRPLMGALFDMQPKPLRANGAIPADTPPLGWQRGWEAASAQLAAVAETRGFRVVREDRLSYDPQRGHLRLVARTDRDVQDRHGQTSVYVDAATGALLGVYLPTGEAVGDTLTTWITTLHMAQVWGLPFRLLMTVVGLLVAVLSITGVVIWLRKRRARHIAREMMHARSPAETGPA